MTNPETGPSKKMRLTLTETNDCDKPTRMNDEEKKLLGTLPLSFPAFLLSPIAYYSGLTRPQKISEKS